VALSKRLIQWKEECWPYLVSEGYEVRSIATRTYNCIAFAAQDEGLWWWPDQEEIGYWPDGVKREETLARFEEAYGTLGYKKCEGGALESGFEKIALYLYKGKPSHAAKQLPDGRWKSKLGDWEDIEHNTTRAVEGYGYGEAVLYMKRPVVNVQNKQSKDQDREE
jgi:hypothetical protein